MKKAFLGVIIALIGSSAFARGTIDPRGCNCSDLRRRAYGLDYVLRNSDVYGQERRSIQSDVDFATNTLRRVRNLPLNQSESQCSQGNQQVDRNWVAWQPWVSGEGADIGNVCGW